RARRGAGSRAFRRALSHRARACTPARPIPAGRLRDEGPRCPRTAIEVYEVRSSRRQLRYMTIRLDARRIAMRRFRFRKARGRAVQVAQESVAQVVDPSMDGDGLFAAPRILHDRRLADVIDLIDHVQLAQPIDGRILAATALDDVMMSIVNVAHMAQPV